MKKRFETKDEALQWCFARVKKSEVGDDYNNLSVLRNRYKNGKLGERSKQSVLDYFKVESHCYFTTDLNDNFEKPDEHSQH